MTRNRSKQVLTAALATLVAMPPSAFAQQTSEQRIQELVREASKRITSATQAGSTVADPAQSGAATGPALTLSLDDAVKMALDRNLDIAVQRLNPQINDIAVASAMTVYRPTIGSVFQQRSSTNAPTSQLQQGANGAPTTDQLQYNGTFTQAVPFHGGSFSAQLNNYRQTSTSNNVTYNPLFQSTWTLNYTQPLFRNFKIDQNRNSIYVAKVNRDISDVQLQATITNTVSNVRNAYWDYVYAQSAVEVAQQTLDLANRLVQDNKTRVEVGTLAPLDVVTAESEAANDQQALIAAQSTKRTAELALKRLIVGGTDDPAWKAQLQATDTPDFTPQPVDIDGAIRRALSQRTDLAIVKNYVKQNDETLKFLKDQTHPQFDLQVAYGTQGVGGTILQRSNSGVIGSTVTGTIPGGITDAFSSLFQAKYPTWTVGVNFSYPLGLSSQEASVARAAVQLNQIGAQMKQIELTVANDVTNAAINVQNTSEAVRAAQASVDLAQRKLDAEQSKFEVGMSTNYNVVLAQRDLANARNSQLSALRNFRKAQVEFERQQQTTLSSANITILGR
jgi:outer membrane protein TolC